MVCGIWQDFLNIIREEVGSRVVETWFKAITFDRWDAVQKIVYLKAPNSFVENWIQKNYLSLFQLHLGRLLHVDIPKIVFISIDNSNTNNDTKDLAKISLEDVRSKNALVKSKRQQTSHINSNYLFENFVIGPSNSLAYAAAHAVTEKLGQLYNPLFIYGGSGLGKTHLLHAIGNEIFVKNRHCRVLYQTADRFVSEFINAIRFNKVHKFKEKYHNIDLLLIDDIQFISNKEQTQEAFFHIFNSLYEAGKQIVFSSDTFPQNIQGIAERLSSRLASGLVTDIHVPSLETKVAILKKKAGKNGENMSDEVFHFIASHIVSNIRELEGAFIRVTAFSTITKQSITLDLAKKVLLHTTQKNKRIVDFELIVSCICKHYPYTLRDLRSKNRNKDLTQVRQIAMYLMKKLTNKSLRDIANFLGGRDHSTVMHALNKIAKSIEKEPGLKLKVKSIEEQIVH